MKLSKPVLFTAALIGLVACTTVNVDSGAQTPGVKDGVPDGSDGPKEPWAEDGSATVSSSDGSSGSKEDTSAPGQDAGAINPNGGDAGGGGGIDGGGGGGIDAGGGGSGDAGGGDGGVVSNSNNWAGWNSTTACPAWNPIPYAWKAPKTSGIGSQACGGSATITFYDAYFGPNATAAAQTSWDASYPGCKQCAVSNWNDANWSAVVKTPNGHFILNQGGCYNLVDPGRTSCGHSSWQAEQCGYEACDATSATQVAYRSCVTTSGGAINATCGEASYGKGRADYVISQSGSSAFTACYAFGFADNDKQTAMRVLTAFCY